MSGLSLYFLIVVLPNFSILATLLFAIFLCATIILYMVGAFEKDMGYGDRDENAASAFKAGKKTLIITVIIGVLGCLTPSKKDLALIYAANYVTNNEQITSLPPKLLSLIHKYIDDAISEDK